MRYDSFKYLFPPRAEIAIPPSGLDEVEARGWWAQPKFNGSNCLVFFTPIDDRKRRGVIQRGRHGDRPVANWTPGPIWQRFAERLPEGWACIHVELLHHKGTGRDTSVLHDMLVRDGRYLVGESYGARFALLTELCHGAVPRDAYAEVMPGIWLAPIYQRDFRAQWDRLRHIHGIEGLVLKDPVARLQLCVRPSANAAWQVKCRYPTANVSF